MSALLPRKVPKEFVGILDKYAKSLKALKKVDPKDRYVLIFPNWENAFVGMGFNLLNTPSAEQVFAQANKILDRDLLRLCLKGPASDLFDSYENKTLATYVTSHALATKFADEKKELRPLTKAIGGIGIGLINSLVFSGSMSFEDGLDLVKRLGQAMDRASEIVPTAKIIVRLRPATSKTRLCRAAREHCIKQGIAPEIAICNVSRQIRAGVVEIAGHQEAIHFLEKEGDYLFEFRWLRRVLKHPHANHTELMRPVSDFLKLFIEQKLREDSNYIKDPVDCSIYSATSAERLRFVKSIKKDLCDYPVSTLKVESLMSCLFNRNKKLAQPNIFVLWDKKLLEQLLFLNRRAYATAKLLKA